jgi:transposase
MQDYSLDLRTRIVQAVTAGQTSVAVAQRCAVSLSMVKCFVRQPGHERGLDLAVQRALMPLQGQHVDALLLDDRRHDRARLTAEHLIVVSCQRSRQPAEEVAP